MIPLRFFSLPAFFWPLLFDNKPILIITANAANRKCMFKMFLLFMKLNKIDKTFVMLYMEWSFAHLPCNVWDRPEKRQIFVD